jgi:hypothetical protein
LWGATRVGSSSVRVCVDACEALCWECLLQDSYDGIQHWVGHMTHDQWSYMVCFCSSSTVNLCYQHSRQYCQHCTVNDLLTIVPRYKQLAVMHHRIVFSCFPAF